MNFKLIFFSFVFGFIFSSCSGNLLVEPEPQIIGEISNNFSTEEELTNKTITEENITEFITPINVTGNFSELNLNDSVLNGTAIDTFALEIFEKREIDSQTHPNGEFNLEIIKGELDILNLRINENVFTENGIISIVDSLYKIENKVEVEYQVLEDNSSVEFYISKIIGDEEEVIFGWIATDNSGNFSVPFDIEYNELIFDETEE